MRPEPHRVFRSSTTTAPGRIYSFSFGAMSQTPALYDQYKEKMQLIADLRFSNAVLQWDQETYLPPKGAAMRGRQISTLSEISPRMFSEPALGELLGEL